MPQTGYVPIQLYHTTTAANVPTLLLAEPAVTVAAANVTKLWAGDGTTARLLLSNVATDTPLGTVLYARLAGAALTGDYTTNQTTFTNTSLVTKQYVDDAVASGQMFIGVYDAATNDPDLHTATGTFPTVNGSYYLVNVGGTTTALIPGIPIGTTLNPGDSLIWNATLSEFEIVPGGGMTQGQADARFLQLAGGTMNNTPTPAVITMGAGYTPTANSQQVATMNALASATANFITTVHTDGTSMTGDGAAAVTTPGTGPIRILAVDGGAF